MPEFTTRDPSQAAFWDERFAANFTPWDQGAVPPALGRWLARAALAPGARVLVPGCGSAYEAAFLDAAGRCRRPRTAQGGLLRFRSRAV